MHSVNGRVTIAAFTIMNLVAASLGSPIKPRWAKTWGAWASLDGGAIDSVAAVSASDAFHLFVRGMADNGVYTKESLNSSSWGQWESLGGIVIAQPTVVSSAPGRLDVFGLGTDSSLYYMSTTSNGNWTDWENLTNDYNGPMLVSAATVVSRDCNLIDAFAIGSDYACWHLAYNGTAWGSWESLNGTIVSQPSAVGSKDRLDVFALGTDSTVWHMAWS
jgi:hypothetical protein